MKIRIITFFTHLDNMDIQFGRSETCSLRQRLCFSSVGWDLRLVHCFFFNHRYSIRCRTCYIQSEWKNVHASMCLLKIEKRIWLDISDFFDMFFRLNIDELILETQSIDRISNGRQIENEFFRINITLSCR